MPDLKRLFEERSGSKQFKLRNAAYKLFESSYNSEDMDRPVLDLAYRPNNVDGVQVGQDQEIKRIVVNQVRRVVSHFTSMFSHRPRVFVLPLNEQEAQRVDRESEYIEHVFRTSNLDALHAQQSLFLSLRGDAVFGVDWNPVENTQPRVLVRMYDPRDCYPLFSPHDLGACEDMLIATRVHPVWAITTFNLPKNVVDPSHQATMFYYWDSRDLFVQIEDYEIQRERRRHDLGFCPFRWIYGDPSGLMAQADCREVPKLQEVFNEGLLLAIDAVRKQVDPAFWVTGVAKDITPEPGVANALPEGSQIGRWPIEADPQIILTVMSSLEDAIYTTTGVSPISMRGVGRGSDRSGAAIRHQVEASDARAETRKVLLESTYARLGEMVLKVTNQQYPEEIIHFITQQGIMRQQGKDFHRSSVCEASYSDFVSNTPEQRFQIALQGLGRVWDERYAISKILNLPGVDPAVMAARLRAYQIEQAKITAEAQAAAQQVAQQAQGGGQGQDEAQAMQSTTQRPQRPPQPSPQGLRRALAAQTGASNGFRGLGGQ